ncbi:hypothetical protein SCALM49S_08074 [Streptomyces californicus]
MNPSARSASATQSAAPSHSLFGNTAGSATDWNATSSASSSRARGISEAGAVAGNRTGGHGHAPRGCDVMCRAR